MKLTVNKWTLDLEGVIPPPKNSNTELYHEKLAMKVVTLVVLVMTVYNLGYAVFLFHGNDRPLVTRITLSLIPDLSSLCVTAIFYILFPSLNISFDGMGCIPMCIFVVLEVEFNSYSYAHYADVSGLYSCTFIA